MALAVLVMALFQDAGQKDPKPPITLSEISERGVVGKLGVPLGTSVAIQAEIVDGGALRRKSTVSSYLLHVTHVDGKKLERPLNMNFYVFPLTFDFRKLPLASSHSRFDKVLDDVNERALTREERMAKKRDYIGSVVNLAAYETGGYTGIPLTLPEGVIAWPDTGFHFAPQLIVLKSLEQ